MSVTITRTAWIDDDGTGTTGTVINNAVKTDLYNQIDGALAKGAQLTGGNAFTGNQTIDGVLVVTGLGAHQFAAAGVGANTVTIQNATAGAGNYAGLNIGNDLAFNRGQLICLSSTASSGAPNLADAMTLVAAGSGGLSFWTAHATGAQRFYTGAGSLERVRITAAGELLVNTPSNPSLGQVAIVTDGAAHYGLVVQNTNPANSINYLLFLNSAGATAGNIAQSGATGVNYGTTSDQRLKTDDGRATDVSALRAVVVHDFTWQADGIRDRGLFAQEAIDLFPRAVLAGTDERTESGHLARPWMTDYSRIVPDLIVGWQHHDAAIAALRAALATLKGSPDAE
jgi:hypothetical protein